MSRSAAIDVEIVGDFKSPTAPTASWNRLLDSGARDLPCLMLEWQSEWWAALGEGELLLVAARKRGILCGIAPLYQSNDLVYFIGSGESDALDFIGNIDERVLTEMLAAVREHCGSFDGMVLYHVPVDSPTTGLLQAAASHLELEINCAYELGAPYLNLTDAASVMRVVDRRKLLKEERRMGAEAAVEVRLAQEEELDAWLECFFAQHVARWTGEGDAKFDDPRQRRFLRGIVHRGHAGGWLQFSMLDWGGRPAAFDITLIRRDLHLGFVVSRDATIERYSPGTILEAHVIRRAMRAGALRYEFGLGEQSYKLTRATGVARVASWELWPR